MTQHALGPTLINVTLIDLAVSIYTSVGFWLPATYVVNSLSVEKHHWHHIFCMHFC